MEGKSDVDLFAVLARDVREEELPALAALHAAFVEEHPAWVERVEVVYASRDVVATLGDAPSGIIAVISPGEPLNIKPVDPDWVINWHGVVNGETIAGPPPRELGPAVSAHAFERAVRAQLAAWRDEVRSPTVAYVPAHQGYIVATICRALYALATGEQTTKERAVEWFAKQHPEWAAFVREALAAYRADLRGPHERVIAFVDEAAAET